MSSPLATLVETGAAIVKSLESLKRDAQGNPLPSWREEVKGTFKVELKSEAAGANEKSFSLKLSCTGFHGEVSFPLTIKSSDRTSSPSGGGYHNRYNATTTPEVAFQMSVPAEVAGYNCRICSISCAGYATCTAKNSGCWDVVSPPNRQVSLSCKVLLSSSRTTGGPPVQLITSMLSQGKKTGDVELHCEDGTVLYAHSAVLIKVPYFSKKFSETWAKERWNLHHKLRCEMPCRAESKSVANFLQYIYGNKFAVYEHDGATLQDLFSLGEACQVPEICSDVADVAQVDPTNLLEWIKWLKGEHMKPQVDVIAKKVSEYVQELIKAKEWAGVSAEALESVVLALQLV